jgi:hypothetical protein
MMLSDGGMVTPLPVFDVPGVISTVGGGSDGLKLSGLVEGIAGRLGGIDGEVAGGTAG